MRLVDAVKMYVVYAGGPGSGCQGPNCGRKPGQAALAENQADIPSSSKSMTLRLNNHGLPILFENDDDLTWHWSPDKKILHIEQVETKQTDYPTGFTQKEVIDVPVENIREWGATDSSAHEWIPAT